MNIGRHLHFSIPFWKKKTQEKAYSLFPPFLFQKLFWCESRLPSLDLHAISDTNQQNSQLSALLVLHHVRAAGLGPDAPPRPPPPPPTPRPQPQGRAARVTTRLRQIMDELHHGRTKHPQVGGAGRKALGKEGSWINEEGKRDLLKHFIFCATYIQLGWAVFVLNEKILSHKTKEECKIKMIRKSTMHDVIPLFMIRSHW